MDATDPNAPPMGVSGSVRALVLDPDRYAIGEVLGEGGMGEVRRCRDTSTGRDVALKAIRAHVDVDDVEVRFLREARVQARLAHPSIVPIYDAGRDAHGRVYFTMKRVEGVTLDDVVQLLREDDGATEPRPGHVYGLHRLLTAFSRVCLAVDYAHARGVLHRDLKPANVMLGAFGEVYVLDWGLAKIGPGEESYAGRREKLDAPRVAERAPPDESATVLSVRAPSSQTHLDVSFDDTQIDPRPNLDGNTQRGIAMGTPAYMAPEQAAAMPLDARADVFSLGAILFEMLALEQLLREDDILAARARKPLSFDARPSQRAPKLDLPQELDAICARATAPDPAHRYPSARALHEAVEAFLAADEEQTRRQRLAATHVKHARALSTPEAGDARRPEALEQLGAALAIAPEDVEARRYLVHLLKNPPAEIPLEVVDRRLQHEVARLRRMQRLSAAIHAASWLLGYPLIVLAGGVRHLFSAFLVPSLWLLTSLVSLVLYRFRTYDSRISWSAIASATALGATSVLWGPLFITPALAVALVFGHVLVATRRQRPQIVALMCVALVVPTVLSAIDVFHLYSPVGMDGEGFVVHGAIGSARNVFFGGLLLCHFGELIFGARFAARYRDILDARVLENSLFSWQLARVEKERDGKGPRPSLVALGASDEMELRDASAIEPAIAPPTESDTRLTGDRRYTKMERLGQTPTAEVWRCLDRRFGREIEMHVALTPRDDDDVRLHARVRGRLEHPAVAPLYDAGVNEHGRAYFTAKYARGVALESALDALGRGRNVAQKERARRRLLTAFGQVCLAVAYAHDRNVCHGNIRAQSIILGSFGEVYLDGWSTAKDASATTDIAQLGQVLRAILDAHGTASGSAAPELDAVCERIATLGIAGPDALAINVAIEAFLSGDRDAAIRRELAHKHLVRARAAAETAFGTGPQPRFEPRLPSKQESSRVEALREIGRAVRLEPENPEALRLLFRLLTEPPSNPPPVVLEEVEVLRAERARGPALGTALFGAFSLVLYPVVAMLLGVRHPIPLALVWLCWAVAEGAIVFALVRRGPPTKIPWPMLATMLAGMATSALSGPFLVAPVIATIATMTFVLVVSRPWRLPTMVLGACVNIIPMVLAWTHVFPTMDMIDNDVIVMDLAVEAPPNNLAYLLLTIIHLLVLLFAAEFAARFRDRLDAVETGFLVRTWQLTKLLPQSPTTHANLHPPSRTTTSKIARRKAA